MLNTHSGSTLDSSQLKLRSLEAVWHPCTQMKQHEVIPLVPIVRGKGVWLYDSDGKNEFDYWTSDNDFNDND